MEVAIVVHRLSKSRGGADGWTTRFIQWLSRQDHAVHLVSSHPPTKELAEYVDRLTLMPKCNRFEFSRWVSSQFDPERADVIHDMGFGYHCDVFQPHTGSQWALDEARAASFEGVERFTFQILRRLGRRQRRLAALADLQFRQPTARFLAVSRKVARDMVRLHGVPDERIDIVHNGVDIDIYSPAARERLRSAARRKLHASQADFLLLCVAHNHQLKGVPRLLKMLETTTDGNVHVVVVGGHKQRPVERTINCNRITFIGACDDVLPYYAAADAFVLPTHYDACSLTVLEAMACGLPVITTLANGASELIDDQVDGLLLSSSTDTTALRESVAVCQCKATRRFLGENARRKALQHSLERNFSAVESIYQKIVSRRRVAA